MDGIDRRDLLKSGVLSAFPLAGMEDTRWRQATPIQGTITDIYDDPVEDAEVRIFSTESVELLTTLSTDAEGEFRDVLDGSHEYVYYVVKKGDWFRIRKDTTGTRQEIALSRELLMNPSVASDSPFEMGAVTIWRHINTQNLSEQVFLVEITSTGPDKLHHIAGNNGDLGSGWFSLGFPQDGVVVDYGSITDITIPFGESMGILSGETPYMDSDIESDPDRFPMHRLHPLRTGLPLTETKAIDIDTLGEKIEFVDDLTRAGSMLLSVSPRIAFLMNWVTAIQWALGETLKYHGHIGSEEIEQRDPNRTDNIVRGWKTDRNGQLKEATARFAVPVRFTTEGDVPISIEAEWSIAEHLGEFHGTVAKEFDVGSLRRNASNSSEGTWPMAFRDAGNTSQISTSLPSASNLTRQWEFNIPNSVPSHVAIDSNIVFVPTSSELSGIDLSSGEKVWSYTVDAPSKSYQIYHPAIHDGIVYWSRKSSEEGWSLAAVSVDDAEELWTVSTSFCNPNVKDGRIYFGNRDGLFSYDSDGREMWKSPDIRPIPGVQYPPLVLGDTVFTINNAIESFSGLTRKVHAINTGDGRERWKIKSPGFFHHNSLAGANGTLYDVSQANPYTQTPDSRVAALDAQSGKIHWKRDISPSPPATYVGSVPAVADETLFIHVPEYRLFALDAESGETLWQRQLAEPSMDKITSGVDGSAVLPPVVGSDSVYVGYEENLFSVNRQNQRVEQVSFDGSIRSLTATGDGVVVVVSTDGGGRVEYFSAG